MLSAEVDSNNTLNISDSLKILYMQAMEYSENSRKWYSEKRKGKRIGSRILRASAIGLGSIGALCPLVDAALLGTNVQWLGALQLSKWGYVSIAAAAAFISFDRFFGLSSGWIRYMMAENLISRIIRDFQYEWHILKMKHPIDNLEAGCRPETELLFTQHLRDFSNQVEAVVKQETDTWALEFQNNLSELEKNLKLSSEQRQPGKIKISVLNSTDFDTVSLFLDGNKVKEFSGAVETLVDSISPRAYEIGAVGTVNGNNSNACRVVEVLPGKIASVELQLPPVSETFHIKRTVIAPDE